MGPALALREIPSLYQSLCAIVLGRGDTEQGDARSDGEYLVVAGHAGDELPAGDVVEDRPCGVSIEPSHL